MTHSPNSDNQREPNSNRRLWLLLLTRTSLALGVILLVGIAGGAWWAWTFIHEELAPLVEKNVKQLLGRPVELGEVERFSFDSLRFGSLSIPATPTDPDRLAAEAVEVEFDPWKLLLNRTLELNVTLVQPDVYVQQAKNGLWVSTQIQPSDETGFIRTELETIGVQNADVVLVPNPEPGKPKGPVVFDQVSGIARLLDQNQRIRYKLSGEAASGGNFNLAGETRLAAFQTTLTLQGEDFLAADVSRLVELPLNLQAGRVDANLKLQLQSNQLSGVFGTVDLNGVTAKAPQLPQPFINAQGTLRFQGMQVQLDNVQASYGKIPLIANGVIDTKTGYNISARLQPVSVASAQQTLNIQLPVTTAGQVGGNLKVTGPILQPTLSGTVASTTHARIDRVNFSNIRTDFVFSTADSEITFKNIQATPTVGGQITGAGTIEFPAAKPGTELSAEDFELDFDFVARNVPADALARAYGASPPITIGDVSAKADVSGSVGNLQTVVQLQAPEATYPGTAEVVITNAGNDQNILIRDAEFNVAGGTVNAKGQFSQGQFQAFVDATGVELNQFSPELRGQLSADLRLEGTSFEPSDVQAQGQVRFSEGLALISQPLTAQVRWNGELIQVQQATAPGLSAEGTIAVRLQGTQVPEITGLNLDVQAQDYNLQDLASNLPGNNNIKLAGQVDFTGQVTGTPTAPNAIGDIRLQNLAVNGLAFDPVLTGNLNFQAGQRTEFQATGRQDRIAFTLGPNNLPTSFFIRRDQAVATGRTQGETLLVDVQRFPVAILQNLVPGATANLGPVAGELSGNLAINLADNLAESTAIGEVAIAQPRIGRITADEFRGRLRYEDGAATLSAGELRLGESRISLSGNLQPGPDRRFQFQINFDSARIENILQALSFYDFQDISGGAQGPELAGAEVLQPISVGLPDAPLISQLRRFEEIETLLEDVRTQREASLLPTLAELNGTISGKIAGSGSLQPGLQPAFNVSFNVLGQDWVWGDYTIDEVIAQGSYDNGVLTLVPLRIDLGEALLALRGQLGQEQLSGQLRVESLPVELVEPFLPELPVEVAGNLNALVTLAGSLEDPRAIGEIALVEGALSGQPVESAIASFSYDNARLNFASTALVTGTEPVEITGSVPVPLPFASVQPDSNQISVNVNVEDEGLALLNLFTNQVTWQEGQGQLNVEVQGTLDQPIILGNTTVKDATLKAQALAEPLTNVTGTVEFNGDRINVQGIQAQYNGEQLTASGVLPIFASQQAQQLAANNPLTVSLDDLEELELQGLYQGGVSGNVVITGTALQPEIGGEIRLMNGQILAGQVAAQRLGAGGQTPAPGLGAGGQTQAPGLGAGGQTQVGLPIEFEDLQLILGEDVRVTLQPVLSVEAMGDVTLNGTLANPRPQGVIRLEDGQINLFTTRFTLDRGYEQTVQFTPDQGFDPILDLRLVATVPEGTGTRIPTTSLSSEIIDVPTTGLGTFETVRVQARVTGPASELAQNLELTSEPGRSEEEIVALLGGSFVNTLGQGDPLLGLANVAGTALLSPFQGTFTQIGEAIGLSELRIYPTIVTDPESEASVLGLATEAVFDISGNFSVSLARVFAADEPFRYNLLYRINDQVLVRGSTNFSGESRALVEYETRF